MNAIAGKFGGVAAMALTLGVMGCAHPYHGHEPVVEETVVVEEPVYAEETVLDCQNPEHHVYKECARYY